MQNYHVRGLILAFVSKAFMKKSTPVTFCTSATSSTQNTFSYQTLCAQSSSD